MKYTNRDCHILEHAQLLTIYGVYFQLHNEIPYMSQYMVLLHCQVTVVTIVIIYLST